MSQAEFVIGRFDWVKNRGGGGRDSFRVRTGRTGRAMGNVRGLPQVMFKVVPNGGCKGPMGLAAQLGYVLGKAEHIIDPNKEYDRLDHLPAQFTEALAQEWADGWERRVKAGHSMHMVASFPRGTDPEKVAEIMRDTCFDILDQGRSRFNYIAALHTDTGFPHVHIVVDRKNADGEWFYFARDGEFTYDRVKDTIVEHAAVHGIEMVNSSKLSRGITDEHEQGRNRAPAVRGLAGTLVEHGTARYHHNPKERLSYLVTVETLQGEKTLWGKELCLVIEASGAQKGDAIRITHEGKEAVQVTTRDGRSIETHRNQWAVTLPDRDIMHSSQEDPAATARGQSSAEWKREQIRVHAAEYRSLSAAFKDGFSALSRGFAAAADLLERGLSLTPEILENVRSHTMSQARQADALDASKPIPLADAERENLLTQGIEDEVKRLRLEGHDRASMSAIGADIEDDVQASLGMPREDELAADAAKALAHIEEARDKLAQVRETITQLEPGTRPSIEAQYFAAVRDVERLTIGLDRAEYTEPAQGTIYADGHREAIAAMDRSQLSVALESTGMDPDEVAARVAVETRFAALEAHWVAVDAEKIAVARGYDMATEDGSRQAYADLAATYRAVSGRSLVAERIVPVVADDRDLAEVIEDRQALIGEAYDLAGREHLSHDQQVRLTEIVEQMAGKDAVHELRGGNSDALSEIMLDKAERLTLAERYLEAEQSRGLDRSDAITAVQMDRRVMELDEKLERQTAFERDYEHEVQVRRERGHDEGHEL